VKQRPGRTLRFLAELLFVLAAAFAGVSAAWPVLHFHENAPSSDLASYFGMFNASAMMGTGHGFVLGSEEKLPALKAFLHGESPQLSLPEADGAAFTNGFSNPFVMSHFYLVFSLGWWWRIMGVSMHSFMLFVALLCAVSAVILYGIFRLGCGRVTALLGALCVVTSPLWLEMAPSVRDFAKAPFVLAFLLLAGWVVLRRFSGRGLLAWALTTGIVLGVGWGFRQDLLVCFLPALLLPWVVRMRERGAWRWRAASCLLLLAALLFVGLPVISAMRADNGAVSVHTMMQGFSEQSESAMSFGDASYVQHADPGDPSAHAVAAAYAVRQGNLPSMGGFHSPSYVAAARRYILETLRTFPADFFRRGLASTFTIPGVTADACRANSVSSSSESPWVSYWARIHGPLAGQIETFGVPLVLLALAVGLAVNFRAAVILAALGVYIGAYPSLLFQARHAFHLSFVPYWAILFLITTAGRVLRRKCRTGALACRSCAGIEGQQPGAAVLHGRAAVGVLAFLALLAATGWFLDQLQAQSVDRLLERYRAAVLDSVDFHEVPYMDGWLLLEPLKPVPGLGEEVNAAPFESAQALLALQLDWAPPVFPVRMVYEGGFVADFSQVIYPLVDDLSKETTLTCFLPVLELNWPATAIMGQNIDGKAERGRFVGVAVPESRRDRVRGLFRVTNAAKFPLHLFVTLPDDKSRFIADKSGPWTKEWELWRARRDGSPDRTVSTLCSLAQRYPYDLRVRRALETQLEACHDPLVASRAWPILLALNPELPAAEVCLRKAKELLSAGNIAEALAEIRRARSLAPTDLRNRVALGEALEASGDDDGALAEYRAVVAEAPESPYCSGRIDTIYGRRNNPAARVDEWRRLVQLHPDAAVPHLHLGLALEASGDAPGARAAYGRALEIDPNLAGARNALERTNGNATGSK
jgi:Flp pilus assembly protein TadD